MRYLLLAFSATFLLSSCAFTKAVIFFKPDITDHKRIFPSDTMPANTTAAPQMARIDSLKQELPPMNMWFDAAGMHEFKDFDALIKDTKTTSLIVMRNDTILYEQYFNGYKRGQQQVVFSVTKAFVAALTAIAVDEGYMRLDQSIADFIPEFANDGRKEIKIQHLLNMTEGLDWMDYKNLWTLGLLYYSPDENQFIIDKTEQQYKPGTRFAYKSITTHILGMCVEKATKTHLADYMNEKIWQPLEMPDQGLFTLDSKKSNHNRALGGMAISARSMLYFGRMMLNNGRWNGKQIVPEDFVRSISERNIYQDKWWGYSNCFWLNGYLDRNYLDMNDYQASGLHGQFIFVSPENNMVLIRTGIADKSRMEWGATLGRLAALLGGHGNDVTNPAKYDFSNQFEGVYETNRSEKIIVVDKGLDKNKMHVFTIYKDVNNTVKMKKFLDMSTNDGRSIVQRKFARQTRLMFEEFAGEVVGAYFDNLLLIDSKYFKKTSNDLPEKYKKQSANHKAGQK
jgi:CubicO group peptidase (beta-lactamase class C family)